MSAVDAYMNSIEKKLVHIIDVEELHKGNDEIWTDERIALLKSINLVGVSI